MRNLEVEKEIKMYEIIFIIKRAINFHLGRLSSKFSHVKTPD